MMPPTRAKIPEIFPNEITPIIIAIMDQNLISLEVPYLILFAETFNKIPIPRTNNVARKNRKKIKNPGKNARISNEPTKMKINKAIKTKKNKTPAIT